MSTSRSTAHFMEHNAFHATQRTSQYLWEHFADTIISFIIISFFPEPLGEIELGLFRAALPYCLKVDSAPFRQKLVTSLKKIFVRIRDSCSTAVKRKTQAQFVGECVACWLCRQQLLLDAHIHVHMQTCMDAHTTPHHTHAHAQSSLWGTAFKKMFLVLLLFSKQCIDSSMYVFCFISLFSKSGDFPNLQIQIWPLKF